MNVNNGSPVSQKCVAQESDLKVSELLGSCLNSMASLDNVAGCIRDKLIGNYYSDGSCSEENMPQPCVPYESITQGLVMLNDNLTRLSKDYSEISNKL